jgi:hypothetical protein
MTLQPHVFERLTQAVVNGEMNDHESRDRVQTGMPRLPIKKMRAIKGFKLRFDRVFLFDLSSRKSRLVSAHHSQKLLSGLESIGECSWVKERSHEPRSFVPLSVRCTLTVMPFHFMLPLFYLPPLSLSHCPVLAYLLTHFYPVYLGFRISATTMAP